MIRPVFWTPLTNRHGPNYGLNHRIVAHPFLIAPESFALRGSRRHVRRVGHSHAQTGPRGTSHRERVLVEGQTERRTLLDRWIGIVARLQGAARGPDANDRESRANVPDRSAGEFGKTAGEDRERIEEIRPGRENVEISVQVSV